MHHKKHILAVFITCVCIATLVPASHYYENNFSSPLGGEWTTNWRYSMEGLLVDPDLVSSSLVDVSNNTLAVNGCPYVGRVDGATSFWYNGFWTGNSVRLDRAFSASPTRPFGVEIKRVMAGMNPDCAGSPPYIERYQSQLDIWLVEDNGTVLNHRDFYNNYFLLYENAVNGGNAAPMNRSTVGWYDGTRHQIFFTNASNALGMVTNLGNTNVHTLDYRYGWMGDTYQTNYTFENGEITNGSVTGWSQPSEVLRFIVTNGLNGKTISGGYSLMCSNTNSLGKRSAQSLQFNNIDLRGRTNAHISAKINGTITNLWSKWRYIVAQYRDSGAWSNVVTNTALYDGVSSGSTDISFDLPPSGNDVAIADFQITMVDFAETRFSNFTFENGQLTNEGDAQWGTFSAQLKPYIITNSVNGYAQNGVYSFICSNTNSYGDRSFQIDNIDLRGKTNTQLSFKMAGSVTNETGANYMIAQYRTTNNTWVTLCTNAHLYDGSSNNFTNVVFLLPDECNDTNTFDFRIFIEDAAQTFYSNYTFENGQLINGSDVVWANITAGLDRFIITNGVNGVPLNGGYSMACSNTNGTGVKELRLNNFDLRGKSNVHISFKFSGSVTNENSATVYLVAQYNSNGTWVTIISNNKLYDGVVNAYTETNFLLPYTLNGTRTADFRFYMFGAVVGDFYVVDDVQLTWELDPGYVDYVCVLDDFGLSYDYYDRPMSNNVLMVDDFILTSEPHPGSLASTINDATVEQYWTPGPNLTNTNAYGIKITHDGDFISVYVNPDPDDNDAYPNEYCLVARKQVLWSNNIKLMIGHEVMNQSVLRQEAAYGSLRVMSAADSSLLSVSPTNILPLGTAQTVTLTLTNTIHATNAGINYIEIAKPADFVWATDASNDIAVSNGYLGVLTNIWMDAGGGPFFPAAGQAGIRTNGGIITIVLPVIISNNIGGSAANEHITVSMSVIMSNSAYTSNSFSAYVESRQFQAMSGTWGRSSTCGPERSTGSGVVTVRKNPAEAYFTVLPGDVNQDDFASGDPVFTLKITATEKTGREHIRDVGILLPVEFASCNFSNVNSSKLGTAVTNYMTFTTVTGFTNGTSSRILRISYPTNNPIFSPNDYDFITMNVTGMPYANTNTNDANLIWTCRVDGTAVTALSTAAETNSEHTNQRVVIAYGADNPWDVYVTQVKDKAPLQMVQGTETAVISFDAYRDGKLPQIEYITGITITNLSTNAYFAGSFSVYTNTPEQDSFTGGVCIVSNIPVSNGTAMVIISNFSNACTNNVDAQSRFWVTFTPQAFNSLASVQFQVSSLSVVGPNSGTVGNFVKFTNYAPTVTKLEENGIVASIVSLMSNTIVQGKSMPALRIGLRCLDMDASFLVNSLRFTLSSSDLADNHLSLALYRDNGSTPGVFDTNDTFIPGSDGVFSSGQKTATLGTPVTIDKNESFIFAVITANINAKIGANFSVALPKTAQTGFSPVGASITNDDGTTAGSNCTVFPAITFDAPVAVAGTMLRPSSGGRVGLYLDGAQVTAFSEYRAYIYDIAGAKVAEIPFTANVAYWDGTSIAGAVVRSGMYIAVIKGPNNYVKRIKVMVIK